MDHEKSVIVLRGGTVIAASGEVTADIVIEDGVITSIEVGAAVPDGVLVLDASGCVIGPGLVDLHTHLRDPGREAAETIATGQHAAALGGYTAIVAMPNTEPAIDTAAVARDVMSRARGGVCDVLASAAITVGRKGTALTPVAELAAVGVTLLTDDGTGVQDAALMRRALDYSAGLNVTLAQHCEDASLAGTGVMHEGTWSSVLGLQGQPSAAEEVMVARDLALVRLTGQPMHFLHLSTAGSVALIRSAKAEGLNVTAEATPHHFTLTDAACAAYDPTMKVNPPLRTEADIDAILVGLADGTIDAIATDHAPHEPHLKDLPFDEAPPGMLGLETALALAVERLCVPEKMAWHQLFELMSSNPARIARLSEADLRPFGHLPQGEFPRVGMVANLCVIDPGASWFVDPQLLASKARNTPYSGRAMTARVRHTIYGGEAVVINGACTR